MIKFDRDKYISDQLPIEFELLKIFSKKDYLTIFEIGACEGEDTIKYARTFSNSKIFSFEPLPKNHILIEQNFKKFNIQNASLIKVALSNIDGETTFHVSSVDPNINQIDLSSNWDYGNKSSSLLPPDKHIDEVGFIKFAENIIVQTKKISTFCNLQNIEIIDIIHMDVQGAELMVLQGADSYINKIKIIWMEVSSIEYYKGQPLVDDVKAYMKAKNFYLLKNTLFGKQGDHLYISKFYFKKHSIIYLKIIFFVRHIYIKVINRLKFL
jgi:FkbM family methyltransferase